MVIDRPNQVWCADITCIPVQRGFLHLVAIMDWATRHVLAWRLSNTMDSRFCVEALNEALSRYGSPEIFNTDQGSQFTSYDFTGVLKGAEITISMDGRGRCMDNIFIERLWRSLKTEYTLTSPPDSPTMWDHLRGRGMIISCNMAICRLSCGHRNRDIPSCLCEVSLRICQRFYGLAQHCRQL